MKINLNKMFKYSILVLLIVNGTLALAQSKTNSKTNEKVVNKISLNAYSFTKPLLDFAKGRGNGSSGMSLYQFMDMAKELGFDAVDLTGYFFPGYPEVPTDKFINDIKNYALKSGLGISGTGVRNDFASSDPVKRAADVKHVKEWIDVAVKMGAPVIRVFSGQIPEGYENRRDEVAKYMAESLKECAEYGKLRGVLVGVQNHGDFLSTADQCIDMVKRVNTKGFGIINDTGYFMTQDPYVDIEKVMPYTVNFQLKESVFGAKSKVKIDLKKIMEIIKRNNYTGYVPIETLSPVGGNKKAKGLAKSKDDKGGPGRSDDLIKKGSKGTEVTTQRPEYDPFKVVPEFLKQVKEAQKEAFNL